MKTINQKKATMKHRKCWRPHADKEIIFRYRMFTQAN